MSEEWEPYGNNFFVLPRIELVRARELDWTESEISTERSSGKDGAVASNPSFWLAVNCCLHAPDGSRRGWPHEFAAAARCMQGVRDASDRREMPAKLPPYAQAESTTADAWASAFDSAAAQMAAGALPWTELARRVLAEFATDVDPVELLFLLKRSDAGRFLLQPGASTALLDSTLAPLLRVSRGGAVEAHAVAAARPRGATAEEDAAQAEAFLVDSGDDAAAAAAVERVTALLAGMGGDVRVSDPFVVTSRHAQLLCRAVRARIAPADPHSAWPAADLLLRAAAAAGGGPAAAAAAAAAEPFDRGFIGGRVGFFSAHAAAFLCPSRAAVCRPRAWHVYGAVAAGPGRPAADAWAAAGAAAAGVLCAARAEAPELAGLANVNAVWAALVIEELVRGGVTHFAVCPGSRSTPLAVAVARYEFQNEL